MHVGDHPQKDADGAKRAGMQVAWHRGTGKYSQIQPELEPDHIIDSLEELRPIFIERYGLALPPR